MTHLALQMPVLPFAYEGETAVGLADEVTLNSLAEEKEKEKGERGTGDNPTDKQEYCLFLWQQGLPQWHHRRSYEPLCQFYQT